MEPPKGHIEPPEIRVGISRYPVLGIRRSIRGEKVSATLIDIVHTYTFIGHMNTYIYSQKKPPYMVTSYRYLYNNHLGSALYYNV